MSNYYEKERFLINLNLQKVEESLWEHGTKETKKSNTEGTKSQKPTILKNGRNGPETHTTVVRLIQRTISEGLGKKTDCRPESIRP